MTNTMEVVGWQCRCACEECAGAEWGNCSKHDYEAALTDPEMQARELVAASDAQAIIAQRDARIEEQTREIERLRAAMSGITARVSLGGGGGSDGKAIDVPADEIVCLAFNDPLPMPESTVGGFGQFIKAQQPSGVVLTGMADALRHVIKELDAEACEDIDYAQVSGALGAHELFGQGLNSSPVTAGVVDERAVKIADRLQGLIEEMGEDGYHGSEICIAAHDYLRNHCAALTASAPSRSEQVREDTRLLDWLEENLADTIYLDDGRIVDIAGRHSVREAIRKAAAPSVGSQGGDV